MLIPCYTLEKQIENNCDNGCGYTTFRSHFAALAPRCDPQLLGISTSRRQLEID